MNKLANLTWANIVINEQYSNKNPISVTKIVRWLLFLRVLETRKTRKKNIFFLYSRISKKF